MPHLPLAVGHVGGDAVRIEPHPAHAEARARAETAGRHLQILRVVVPVGDDQAGHAHECLGEAHHRPGLAQLLGIHAAVGMRKLEPICFSTAATDHHGGQFVALSIRLQRSPGSGQGRKAQHEAAP